MKALASELSELRAEVKALHARLERLEQEKASASTESVQGQGLASGQVSGLDIASGQGEGLAIASSPAQGLEQEKISEDTPPVEPNVEVEVAAV